MTQQLRRLRQLRIAGDLLFHNFTFGFRPPYFVTKAIPDGAKIIWTGVVPSTQEGETVVGFIIEHESFDLVDPNGELPDHEIAFEPVDFEMKEDEEAVNAAKF